MPMRYKENMLDALKSAGLTTYQIRRERLLSEGCVQSLRAEKPISWSNIEALCRLLKMQPGDILEYVED